MQHPPDKLIASAPAETQWFGGSVDLSTATLRIGSQIRRYPVDKEAISKLLAHPNDEKPHPHWCLAAPESQGADLDHQIAWIFSRLTQDLLIWKTLNTQYRIDLFTGLFLNAPNRGIELSPKSLKTLSDRGIKIGFDIYFELPKKTKE